MINKGSDKIEFYYKLDDLQKSLHNRSAYVARGNNEIKPFKDEDTQYFNDVLIKSASNEILSEIVRYAKEINEPLVIGNHIKAEGECIIYSITPNIDNTGQLPSVDKKIEEALQTALVYHWFANGELALKLERDKDKGISDLRSTILILKETDTDQSTDKWL